MVINLCSALKQRGRNIHRTHHRFVELFHEHTSWARPKWSDEYSKDRVNDKFFAWKRSQAGTWILHLHRHTKQCICLCFNAVTIVVFFPVPFYSLFNRLQSLIKRIALSTRFFWFNALPSYIKYKHFSHLTWFPKASQMIEYISEVFCVFDPLLLHFSKKIAFEGAVHRWI